MNYIGKSYLQLTTEEKDYFIKLYYENLNLTVEEIGKELGLSKRCTMSIFKEYKINSKRKNRYTLNEMYFEEINSQQKSYILGLIYADGFIGNEKFNNVSITQKENDVLEKIKKELEYTGKIRFGNKGGFENSKPGYVLNFSSKKMTSDLRRIGLYPNKSLTIEKMPEINNDLKRHFLRGYFDGDGSISKYIHTFKKGNKEYSYEKGKLCI
ncbi:MAG: LAGLIDADG family homing endonuclease, partial [Peptostreptococcaceae bacterium]